MKTNIKALFLTLVLLTTVVLPFHAISLNQASGTISVLNEQYNDSLYMTWDVNTGTYDRVILSYNVNVEGGIYDYVYIFNVDEYGVLTLLTTLDENSTMGTITTSSYSGKVRVVFITDGGCSFSDCGYSGIHIRFQAENNFGFSDIMSYKGNTVLNGNVGIGILEPLAKLDINGAIRGNASGGALRVQTDFGYTDIGSQGQGFSHFNTDRNYFLFNKPMLSSTGQYGSLSTNLSLQTSLTPRLTILNSNGNVGIGTTTPMFKLDVNGKIRSTEMDVKGLIRANEVRVVSIDSFADFVFNKEYRLRELSEVSQFIDQNGHLPEMPSAKEVKENGMSLAEMQVKLLQKVEELTLYAIEQQKKIEKLEKALYEVK